MVESKAIVTDPLLWTAILNNLLGNAVSHAPRGAHMLVEASTGCLAVSNEAPDFEAKDLSICLNGSGENQKRAPKRDIPD